jgi:ubiquitin-protein ligase
MDVLNKLETMKEKHISRRVKREYSQLILVYENIDIEINDDNLVTIKIQKKSELNGELNNYYFILSYTYPFHPPKIFVNNKTYNKFLTLPSARFTRIFHYINGPKCMCCSSITLNHNWSPALTIENILKEIEIIRQYKYEIIIKVLADNIKNKYLIMDIDLDSYLFNVSNPFLLINC